MMDDHNGECFEPHEELFGAINTSDSEHECLKEFLLEPEDVSITRSVPCSVDSSDVINSFIGIGNHVGHEVGAKLPGTDQQNVFENPLKLSHPLDNNIPVNNFSSIVNSHGSVDTGAGINSGFSLSAETGVDGSHSSGQSPCVNFNSVGENIPQLPESVLLGEHAVDFLSQQLNYGNNSIPECEGASSSDCVSPNFSTKNINDDESDEHETHENVLSSGRGGSGGRGRGTGRGRKRKVATESSRGRAAAVKKRKQQVTTYQSQISPDQNGIKLRIKMSSRTASVPPTRRKERSKKRRSRRNSSTDDEASEGESNTSRRQPGLEPVDVEDESQGEQSVWGEHFPPNLLKRIFMMLTYEEGCMPFLLRMSRVCQLWRNVALSPSLWHTIDLSGLWVKERYRNYETFRWLCENRLTRVQELSVGGWKYISINFALESICLNCQQLTGLGLNGWEGLTADHVKYLITNCPGLARLDLSSINPESSNSRGALSLGSLSHLAQEMGERLTHLVLADNTLSGLPQIINALATYCPGLQVLDLSNLRTHTTAHLHIEKLQEGCQNLRVLRITNSTVCLASATLQEQAAAPGFPALEELSAAGLGGNGLCSNPVMDDNSVERILKNSYKLRLLDVRGGARVTDSSLVRVPAWDLEHLFLSGCCITRGIDSGLELVVQKWSHSLKEVDLAWSTATEALDSAVQALAERGEESPLRVLNLCGSSVSLEPVKEVLMKCPLLSSLNLSSCRALPRGMKRLYEGVAEVAELRGSFKEKPDLESEEESESNSTQEQEKDGQLGEQLMVAMDDTELREHGGVGDDPVMKVG